MNFKMNALIPKVYRNWIAAAVLGLLCFTLAGQASQTGADIQRQAMQKLAFLAGHWSGPITVVRGPGEPLNATQSEDVAFKLDGLVLLVEGKSTAGDGKVEFSAMATISYDDATKTYRFRAYHDGQYIDTELAVTASGFSWGFQGGPAHVVNTMHLTDKGEWQESTSVNMESAPPRQVVDMLLKRQQ
jgi:hypothetical protein